MKEDSEEQVLLAAARHGDHSAFLTIFRRYGTRIFRFLYRFLGSAKAAEDLTHDCFLELVRNSENVRFTDNSLLIQLFSTARKLAIERSREQTKNKRPQGDIDEESVEKIKELIKALPPLERETLILFEYEGLSARDIAQIVKADNEVVQMRLNQARETLWAALSREADTSNEL